MSENDRYLLVERLKDIASLAFLLVFGCVCVTLGAAVVVACVVFWRSIL